MRMYWDTETTGVSYSDDFYNHHKHPAIMEYAHVICDDEWNELSHFQAYVRIPDSIEIHERAYAAHGITRERCAEGITSLEMFRHFVEGIATVRLVGGYNQRFDLGMMEVTYHRLKSEYPDILPLELPAQVDLMRYATPLCQLPPTAKMIAAGRNHFKSPSLAEALRILCKFEIGSAAHGALADSRGCALLHKKIWEMQNGN